MITIGFSTKSPKPDFIKLVKDTCGIDDVEIIQKINSRIAPRDLKEPRRLLLSLNSRLLRRGTHLLLYSPFRLSDRPSPILNLLFNSSLRKIRIKRRRGLRLLNLLAQYLLWLR
jgi:hypothetical protein